MVREAITGYNTETNRKRVYKKLVNNPDYLSPACEKVYEALKSGPKTGQEISELIDMKEHLVFARLNDLRKLERVIDTKEKPVNTETNMPNTKWKIVYGQRKLF